MVEKKNEIPMNVKFNRHLHQKDGKLLWGCGKGFLFFCCLSCCEIENVKQRVMPSASMGTEQFEE